MPDLEKIHKSLLVHGVNEKLTAEILEGWAEAVKSVKKEKKAEQIAKVIERMDALLPPEQRGEILDWCACCKGGSREAQIKRFVRENEGKSLAEKINLLRSVPNMGKPELTKVGTLMGGIAWKGDGGYQCPCPNFSGIKLKEQVSVTYCYCCAGHFRHHYQNALGVKLKVKQVACSVLESCGERPCVFEYLIVKE